MSAELPTGWRRIPLRDAGLTTRRPLPFTGTRPYLATADVRGGALTPSEDVSFAGRPARADLVLAEDDVLQAKMKLTNKAALITKDQSGWLASTGFAQFAPDSAVVLPKFLFYWIASEQFCAAKDALCVGSTQQAISDAWLGGMEFLVCPVDEQKRVAALLDAVNGTIRMTEMAIAKLQLMKQGLLHDLLSRGLDAHGRLRPRVVDAPHIYYDSAIGPIPTGWEVRPLDWVAEVNRGKFTHRPRNDPRFYGGTNPFIQTGDITAANGEVIVRYGQTLSKLGAAVSIEFPAGTIAITIAANIADTAILGVPMYFPDSVVGAVVKPPHCTRFIEMCLQRAKPRLEARAPQSAQKNINLQDLRPLPIAVPPPEEQLRIAATYEHIATRAALERTTLEKLKAFRSGLALDLLTGRVRVPSAAKVPV